MLNIMLVSTRQENLLSFTEALQTDQDVRLETFDNPNSVLDQVGRQAPQLIIIDDRIGDVKPLDLAMEVLKINALVNIAVVSSMDEDAFHEAGEGLGLLPGLPSPPGAVDAPELLRRLREMPGLGN